MKASVLIDTHCYCLSPRLGDPNGRLPESEREVFEAIHQHPEGPHALSLSTPVEILESMGIAGVDQSVLTSFPWNKLEHCKENNDFILEQSKARPEVFQTVCSINPAEVGYLKEAERVLDEGALGIKMNPNWQHFQLSQDRCLYDLCALVNERNAYFLIHTDQAFRKTDAMPGDILDFAQKNPKTKIVAAHMGGLLGAYYPFLSKKLNMDNLWYDTAVSETLYMVAFYAQVGLEDRILFGSDYPFNVCHSQVDLKTRIKDLGLGQKIEEKVFFKNFKSFLELKL